MIPGIFYTWVLVAATAAVIAVVVAAAANQNQDQDKYPGAVASAHITEKVPSVVTTCHNKWPPLFELHPIL